MKGKLPLKIPDIVIILLAAGLTGLSAFMVYMQPRDNVRVVIQGINQVWVYPLDAEETINVQGPLGDTIVRLHGNEAWVVSSPCDNQTCVGMGRAGQRGDWVACLPNSVFFIIEGTNGSGNYLDSTAW